MFQTEGKHSPLSKVLKEVMQESDDGVMRNKKERNRFDRRRSKQELRMFVNSGGFSGGDKLARFNDSARQLDILGLSQDLLNKPFSKFDNQDLRTLVSALNKL